MNDLEVYRKAISVLGRDENIALITAVSTTGSTPGKVGYKMLVWGKDPETFGTVGGGLGEAEIVKMAQEILPGIENQIISFSFDGTRDDAKGTCGGSIELLIETFDKRSLPLFKELSDVIANGGRGVLISTICSRKAPEKILLKSAADLETAANIRYSPEIIASVRELLAEEQSAKITLADGVEIFVEAVCEQPMVFIFGAGHLSYYISRCAQSVNLRVTVCDDRIEFANKSRFPNASNIIVENYEQVFDKISISSNSYIVLVTKGHKSDEIILEQAVKTNAKYIGMIGSKKKTLTMLKRLHEKGIPAKALKRVYSPIGISIGAVTPEEIALSIVCELIKIRRLGDAPETSHMRIALPEGLREEGL